MAKSAWMFLMVAAGSLCGPLQGAGHIPARDYFRGVHPDERHHIQFIVEILAHKNLASIWMHQSDLNAAGDRLAAMHPFRFLEVLLADPHVCAGVLKIRDRGMVWPSFYDGIRGSLQLEAGRHNLTTEQIHDFAHRVHTDADWVSQMVHRRSWEQLVDGLFAARKSASLRR
jgi:hypothetical protein